MIQKVAEYPPLPTSELTATYPSSGGRQVVTVVVDASVVLKWLLQDPAREVGTEKATQLMESVTKGELMALQPMHRLAEVSAVLARESPRTAADDVTMLSALQLAATDDPLVLRRGVELAIELKDSPYWELSRCTTRCEKQAQP